MTIQEPHIKALVDLPSHGAVTYQAMVLIHELNRINDEEYPVEACRVRDVLLCVADSFLHELHKLESPTSPYGIKGGFEGQQRLLIVSQGVQKLYAFLRYLLASSPRQTPPAVQVGLSQLVDLYFPKAKNGEPVCLVRPQWKYNLSFIALYEEIKKILKPPFSPDTYDQHKINTGSDIIRRQWKRWRKKLPAHTTAKNFPEPPDQLAVLSFAGLDTHDALLYPLIGHELGHFIDQSFERSLHLSPSVTAAARVPPEEVEEVLKDFPKELEVNNSTYYSNILYQLTLTCLKEFAADLIATRMLGFSYFVSLAELLKTIKSGADELIQKSGYPGVRYRLSIIYEHLTEPSFLGNIVAHLKGHPQSESSAAAPLLTFMELWGAKLKDKPEETADGTLFGRFMPLVKAAIERARQPLLDVIRRECIPDERCAQLSDRFLERVKKLNQDLPPCFREEDEFCFAEIMSAAWAYQIIYGEDKENNITDLEERLKEYRKTCRLVLKAVELIPLSQDIRAGAKDMPNEAGAAEALYGGADGDIENQDWLLKGGVLGAPYIRRRLHLPIDDPSHLGIVPLNLSTIQPASVDVHLGNWFTVAKRTKLRSLHLGRKTDERIMHQAAREEIFVPFGKSFLIHPGDLVISATLEFIALPADLMAFIEGKSTLGRQGLFINTAAAIAPGFHGVVVLELANTGAVPLEVTPGTQIAQIMFQKMTEPLPEHELYRGRFFCQIKP